MKKKIIFVTPRNLHKEQIPIVEKQIITRFGELIDVLFFHSNDKYVFESFQNLFETNTISGVLLTEGCQDTYINDIARIVDVLKKDSGPENYFEINCCAIKKKEICKNFTKIEDAVDYIATSSKIATNVQN